MSPSRHCQPYNSNADLNWWDGIFNNRSKVIGIHRRMIWRIFAQNPLAAFLAPSTQHGWRWLAVTGGRNVDRFYTTPSRREKLSCIVSFSWLLGDWVLYVPYIFSRVIKTLYLTKKSRDKVPAPMLPRTPQYQSSGVSKTVSLTPKLT